MKHKIKLIEFQTGGEFYMLVTVPGWVNYLYVDANLQLVGTKFWPFKKLIGDKEFIDVQEPSIKIEIINPLPETAKLQIFNIDYQRFCNYYVSEL